jgi:uncharacterized protein
MISIKALLIAAIKVYQNTISPDHGWFRAFHPYGYCRFSPTCSMYAVQALERYSLPRALVKIVWRVLRCNPWNKGGKDNP